MWSFLSKENWNTMRKRVTRSRNAVPFPCDFFKFLTLSAPMNHPSQQFLRLPYRIIIKASVRPYKALDYPSRALQLPLVEIAHNWVLRDFIADVQYIEHWVVLWEII